MIKDNSFLESEIERQEEKNQNVKWLYDNVLDKLN